jgi:hypothetical protein
VFDELEEGDGAVDITRCLIKFIDHQKVTVDAPQADAAAGQVAQWVLQDRKQALVINRKELEKQAIASF